MTYKEARYQGKPRALKNADRLRREGCTILSILWRNGKWTVAYQAPEPGKVTR
jgi:hypothetical protein